MADEFIERRLQSNGQTVNFNIDRTKPYIETTISGQKARVYGTQSQLDAYQNKKPDGTPNIPAAVPKNLPEALAKITTGSVFESAVNKIVGGKPTVEEAELGMTHPNPRHNLQNLVENPLEHFASFSPLWTLAVLTPEQFNNPSLYRTDDLSFADFFDINIDTGSVSESSIIFSSAGRGDNLRTNTKHGSPEYYIENFKMKTVIAPGPKTGNTNAIKFDFEVIEPYSMGLLLQSLQVAAIKAGWPDYFSAPFLLRLDIKGWSETGKILSTVKPKYFVLYITKATFNVNEGGCVYSIQAVPTNHQTMSDVMATMYKDISLTATRTGTVDEILVSGEKSLCAQLNQNEQNLVDEGKIGSPDVYEIHFPTSASSEITVLTLPDTKGATTSSTPSSTTTIKGSAVAASTYEGLSGQYGQNPFGQSGFGFDATTGGNFVFKHPEDVVDEKTGRLKRDKMEIDVEKRTFYFSQSQTIMEIINSVVTTSLFAKRTITNAEIDAAGMITWFRIDGQMEYLDFDPIIGDYARKIIYRVVPYKVHHTVFSNPTSMPIGYGELAKKITKSYDYIYTGQNADIIGFDIQIDNLFYVGGNPSPESNTRTVVNPDQQGPAPDVGKETTAPQGTAPEAQTANLGRARVRNNPALLKKVNKGGAATGDTEQMVAEAFHQAFIDGTSADLVKVDLEILGDPYWIVDNGIANYHAAPALGFEQMTVDGTANCEDGDVFIYLSFRTPADIDLTEGLYKFSPEQKESPFSGIYKVVTVENHFNQGKFTQSLHCIRMPGQAQDYDGKQSLAEPDKKNTMPTKVGNKKEPPTSTAPNPKKNTTDNNSGVAPAPVSPGGEETTTGSSQGTDQFDDQYYGDGFLNQE